MGEGLTPPCPKIAWGQQQLTPEQAAYARQFAQERIAVLLSTEPIDEQEAEEHLREAYRVIAEQPPATIRWFDSPLSFALAGVQASMWALKNRSRSKLRQDDSGRRRIWDGTIRSIWNSGRWDSGRTVWSEILSIVAHAIEWESAVASIRGYSGSIDTLEVEKDPRRVASVRAYFDAGKLAGYRFLHEVCEENELIHLARFNELVSGYVLGSEEAWLVRKPVLLERDERGRLHNANGPCLQYRDGWSWYAWHGVSVPEKLIMHPEQLTRADWMNEGNMEVRRAIQERLGPECFIEMVGGRQIDVGRRGKLIEIDLGPRDPERVAHYVQVQDSSTERHYYLRVPPSISRADEAIAWTFGLSAHDYQPGQET